MIEETKNYVVLKVPRSMIARADFGVKSMSEETAFKILLQGMNEYGARKTKTLRSLRDLRFS